MGLIRGTVNLGKYWGDVTRQGMTQFQLDEDMDLTQEDTQVSSQGKQLRQLTIVFLLTGRGFVVRQYYIYLQNFLFFNYCYYMFLGAWSLHYFALYCLLHLFICYALFYLYIVLFKLSCYVLLEPRVFQKTSSLSPQV